MATNWFVQGVAGCSERNIIPPRPVYLVILQVERFVLYRIFGEGTSNRVIELPRDDSC